MKLIATGGLSVSAAVRRQTTRRSALLRRNKSTAADNEPPLSQPTSPAKGAGTVKPSPGSPASQPHHHPSATASAGGPVPSVPESPSRSLHQIIKASPLGKAAGWYSREQYKRPYWTQMWSTLVIYLCADLCAQLVVSGGEASETNEKEDDKGAVPSSQDARDEITGLWSGYDPLRTARHLTVGAVAAIPVYRWFMFLHRNFNYSSKALSILAKVAVSQTVFTPTFNTYFFTMQSLLSGATLEDTWERVKKAVPNSVMNSVKLWPGVTAFLFLYVEPQFRSIVSGVVAVGWQTYLSWLNQKAAKEVRQAASLEKVELLEGTSTRKSAIL
ncbi:uncharacterized protein CIMG_03389 [Coccidioides immitis RS]|uniref:Integral membrane protein n=3 Tax=Coccidioides immitis TaxID=5501 RepID=A0A0E1RXP6_COCIM|nr:uncharacterized protein CIMG_03389 [Coccidioides immitis RS]EAS32365.1 integral membrane protein [Coccidioides immitis RS]KMP07596.1 hypothetical protein CIRG_07277 [Coccidioides immitis RMSCC 2394]KMU71952.1 hypothetical protein CISG_00261 [Coccidioides immitis RMSCC 3703]TPX19507.1 hypothetical protein DIZ76_017299 [Coccidioides immitis]